MVGREVIWSLRAIHDKLSIYNYWIQRTGSVKYAGKLEILFIEVAEILAHFPDSGVPTEFADIRVSIVRDYKLFYRVTERSIVVLTVWDSRMNPTDLAI